MIRPFWQPRLGAFDDEWALYMLKGPIWYAWFLLQVKNHDGAVAHRCTGLGLRSAWGHDVLALV